MRRRRDHAVGQIIKQLERTRKLLDLDPRGPLDGLADVDVREHMRTHIVSVVEELARWKPSIEEDEILEATLALRRVGFPTLNGLIEQLEGACAFRNATRSKMGAAAVRLRRVAKIRPKLADKLEDAAKQLEEEAERMEPSPKSLEQPGVKLKIAAAEEAFKLIAVFTDARATKTKVGVFREITALLLQAAMGGEHNVDRACDAVLRAR